MYDYMYTYYYYQLLLHYYYKQKKVKKFTLGQKACVMNEIDQILSI